MKNIKNILAIVLLVIFAVACTNEEDYQNDNRIKNKSLMGEESPNEYIPKGIHQYEQNDYSEDQIISIMSNFTELINYNKISEQTYDINKAVFAMETFFNIAIVDKQKDFERTNYDSQKFNCIIELNQNGEIESTVLRNKYISFLNAVMSSMGSKFLQYSNIYVKEVTSSNITIILETPPFVDNGNFIPRRDKVVRNKSELYTDPINDIDDWNNYFTGSVDEVVRLHSKKIVDNICFLNIHSFFTPFPPSNILGYFASTQWINDGTPMSLITGLSLSTTVNTCIIHANDYTVGINQAYPPYVPRTIIDVIPLCEIRWDVNKRYMKLLYINELKYAFVPTVRLRNILYDMAVVNRDVFEF
ncbi:hypothetical protein SDC9_27376 [bioreactor metagenome]|jgi:hypothetical protein|uniref:Lipoprotein n=1 Tax=bioreactor metagenome TaxID=1076179 RepID=A0A644UQX3_9ZZZZ